MKKFIKVENERIVDIRPLTEVELYKDEELLKQFKKEFTEVEIPEGYNDIEILSQFIYKDGKFTKTDIFLHSRQLGIELDEIRLWLKNNDWVPNKIITGEWTENDKRWTDYLKERKAKRTRQDEIKALLGV